MNEYNNDGGNSMYTRPAILAFEGVKYRNYLTKGLSDPEIKDFDTALD